MKANLPKTPIVVLIVALLLSMWLSVNLARQRETQTIRAPHRAVRAGFGKFLSQIGWMRLIQFRGSMNKLTEEDASRMARRFDQITDLDPMFVRAYEEGAFEIGFQSPQAALQLIDKAMAIEQLNDWRLPYVAGFIAKQVLKDNDRALRYYEAAAREPNHPDYVERSVVYLKVAKAKNDPLTALNLWVDYYAGGPGNFFRDPDPAAADIAPTGIGGRFQGFSPMRENDNGFAANRIRSLSAQIVDDARKKLETETDPARKKTLDETIAQARKIVNRLSEGGHACPRCFQAYNAGDRFCSKDGTPLEVFGVCPKDNETIVHGAYCHKCGAKAG